MDAAQRLERVEQIVIHHPRMEHLRNLIRECHEYSRYAAEPECLFIKGHSGVGKSTLLDLYSAGFPRYRTEEGCAIVPVFKAKVPSPASVKSLASRLLRALGDPAHAKGTTSTQTTRLYELMEKCKVELLLLDEFQHIIDPDSAYVLKSVSDWLKVLIEETRVPVVLIGLPNSDVILDANEQLDSRFATREVLEPFRWDNKNAQNEFRRFLRVLDENLPFDERARLGSPDMAIRFFYASGGILRPVMKLVRRASRSAISQSLPSLNLDVLAEAYIFLNKGRDNKVDNPFDLDVDEIDSGLIAAAKKATEREAEEDVYSRPRATNRRVKSKTEDLTAADILRRK